ncbi:MAG: patatin-like phospholipase family protein [Acidimicrobiia bacterium]
MRPIRVLSIDGGGIRGIIPARVLAELESIARRPVCELFDVIVGTSIGGIAAMGLALPREGGMPDTAAQIGEFYVEHGPLIFPKTALSFPRTREDLKELIARVGTQAAMFGSNPDAGNARYSPAPLERALGKQFGDARMSDAMIPIIVIAYDVTTGRPALFRSRTGAHLMRDVARATSAAPTVFPPMRLTVADGSEHIYIDGGVFANNPSMVGYTEAMELAGWKGLRIKSLRLVSIGTGVGKPAGVTYEQFTGQSWVHLAEDMFQAGNRGRSALDDALLRNLLGGRYHRFDPILPTDIALDDASSDVMVALRRIADDYVVGISDELSVLAERLIP